MILKQILSATRRIILSGFFFLLFSGFLFSQQLDFAFLLGSGGKDNSVYTTTDNSGNVYIAGLFNATVDFDPGFPTANMTSAGTNDAFLAKYDASGQYLWSLKIGGGGLDKVEGIATDASGNVIITGFFRGANVDFDPGAGTASLSSNGDSGWDPGYGGDLFVAKYTASGQYLWAFNIGGSTLYDDGISVKCDNAGNIYLGGYFREEVDFDPSIGTEVLDSDEGTLFLAKYTAAGNFLWAFNTGRPNNDNAVYDIALDNSGGIFITGFFQGTNIDFDPGSGTASLSANGYDIYVAKYTTNGDFIFAFKIGGSGFDAARGIDVDGNGNIYVIGDFASAGVDFDPGTGTAILSSAGGSDAFIASYTSSGDYRWAFNFGSAAGPDNGWKVSTDNDHIYITGAFSGVADMDPGAGTDNLTSNGGVDIFLGKYSLLGEYICSFNLGSTGNDYGYAIQPIDGDRFYLTGNFAGTADFEPGAGNSFLTSAGGDDIFLARYLWADNEPPGGTLSGDVVCEGEQAVLIFYGDNPLVDDYTIVVNNGTTDIVFENVQTGVPININPNPTTTTVYTLVSVKDDQRCAETNYVSGIQATVTVNNCNQADTILNKYTEVLSFDVCKNLMTVTDASDFNVGDTVLLIQMKGAVVDSTNSESFGDVTDYRGAGNYEYNIISNKNGNELELLNIVEKQYNIPDGIVQLIRVPYYESLTLTQNIVALPWDGRKGGVIAINVLNSIVMNANIDASGQGFRGGAPYNTNNISWTCNQMDYYYPLHSQHGATKGEGIAVVSDAKINGRGALANGGGGGNEVNAGGGGGANGGIGGFGGYQFADCGTANDVRGIGGNSLLWSVASDKLFLGGGGGAGEANNPGSDRFASGGGNGGGLIIISASSIQSGSGIIRSNGTDGENCQGSNCHEGYGGGGAGGTVILNADNFNGSLSVEVKGGNGGNNSAPASEKRHGPGAGGGGGVVWFKAATQPGNVDIYKDGGENGVNINFSNDPHGATDGIEGITLTGFQISIDEDPFVLNIDSVRIKDSLKGCGRYDFKGLAYINHTAIASWEWTFGDGSTAATQNVSYNYTVSGNYTVKLVVTDLNGCKDSTSIDLVVIAIDFDFQYTRNACSPYELQFQSVGTSLQDPEWWFGDGTTVSGTTSPLHMYPGDGVYQVQYSVTEGPCRDTISKNIDISVVFGDEIITGDTVICKDETVQLFTRPSLNFCWSPTTWLDDPALPNPVSSTPELITYHFTTMVEGDNIVDNGAFDEGNAGFSSEYIYTTSNAGGGEYFIGSDPQAWNPGFSNCSDQSGSGGNMMIVNGDNSVYSVIWQQSVSLTPNTDYAFSVWVQSMTQFNTTILSFAVNGKLLNGNVVADLNACNWTRFYVTWNSGTETTANISIVNRNAQLAGNDFALDNISFAPVYFRKDSVVITPDEVLVRANADTIICLGETVQLEAEGADSYSWTPGVGLSTDDIANPLATPTSSTEYIVTGTSASGCSDADTVMVDVRPLPEVSITNDTLICSNASVQLQASGGVEYEWSPPGTLDDHTVPDPVATPTAATRYYVSVTDISGCVSIDSVQVDIRPDPEFSVSGDQSVCSGDSAQLTASGGDLYEWQPTPSLDNPYSATPKASPASNTEYFVTITDNVCGFTETLSTELTVMPLPIIEATSSNDIDCALLQSQLNATGGEVYQWWPEMFIDDATISNPIVAPVQSTWYKVEGTDANGCKSIDSVLVAVDFTAGLHGFYIPNAFTPNNDGRNDCFGVRYWGQAEQFELQIFNRWGQKVFETNNIGECWDGKINGVEQSTAVFVYQIRVKSPCSEGLVYRKGHVTLIR